MRKIISLLGKPCAGKGTRLSKFLEENGNQYTVVSFGDALRKEVANKTTLGRQAEYYMEAGKLIPDYIIINMVLEQIRKAPEDKSIILDGFPRTLGQAEAAIECEMGIKQVVHLKISDETVLKRSASRIVCQKCGESYTMNSYKKPKKEGVCDKCGGTLIRRNDDSPEVVKERLETYHRETEPVFERLAKSGVDILEVDSNFLN